jgi:hypothetical protein
LQPGNAPENRGTDLRRVVHKAKLIAERDAKPKPKPRLKMLQTRL